MDTLPLSRFQKAIWLEWKLASDSCRYNTPIIFHIRGTLYIQSLELALSELIRDYCKSFHYLCREQDGNPSLVLQEIREVTLYHHQYPGYTGDALRAAIAKHTDIAFDLNHGPLYKFELLHLAELESVLVLNFHHFISDAVTAEFIIKHASNLYNHYAHHQEKLPPPGFTMPEYIAYEISHYTDDAKNKDYDYWYHALRGKTLLWQSLSHKPSHDSAKCQVHYFELDVATYHKIKALISQLQTTLFTTLSALFSICLKRLGSSDEIILGYPVECRPEPFRELAGCAINTIPIIVDLSKPVSFASLIQQLNLQRSASRPHQQACFSDILLWLKQQGLLNHDQHLNVAILPTFFGNKPLSLMGLECSGIPYIKNELPYDLELSYQIQDTLAFRLCYRSELFSSEFIHHLEQQFLNAFLEVLVQPEIPHTALRLQPSSQYDFASERVHSYPNPTKNVFEVFQSTALHHRDNLAILQNKEKITYQMLYTKVIALTAHLQHHLSQLPKASSTRILIGVLCARSVNQIALSLAIWKVQAVLLPLSTHMPITKLNKILSQATPQLIVCDNHEANKLAMIAYAPETVQILEALIQAPVPPTKPQAVRPPEKLAYLLFTSGSSGEPKGVMVEHRTLLSVIENFRALWEQSILTRILSFTEISFDIYFLELLLPLLYGNTHIIAPNIDTLTLKQIRKLVQFHKPSWIQGTPSFWQHFITALGSRKQSFMSVCGGEKLSDDLAQLLIDRTKTLWHVYGPTEATIWISAAKLSQLPVHLGSALPNNHLVILDRDAHPCAAGVVGEIYLAGANLAAGYWQDEALTSEKFIYLPYAPHIRYYRTGDLAYLNSENQIIFVGRKDRQLKFLGNRIDLSELETQLQLHPELANCAILSQANDNSLSLRVFYTTHTKNPIQPEILTRLLAHYQNLHGVKVEYQFLIQFPLTVNQKINYQALNHLPVHDNQYTIARAYDLLEYHLQKFWQTILGHDALSVDSDFFHSGGHSLLGIVLLSKINDQFQLNLPVSWLYEHTTIAKQSTALRQLSVSCPYQPIQTFQAAGTLTPLLLVHPIMAGSEVYYDLAKHFSKDLPLYGIDSYHLNSGKPMMPTLHALANYYVKALKKTALLPRCILGGWSYGGIIAYEMAQILREQEGIEVELLLLDAKIYGWFQLHGLGKQANLNNLLRAFPKRRGEYLLGLPKSYVEKVTSCIKQDIKLTAEYTFKPYAGPVTLIRSNQAKNSWFSRYNGWNKYCKNLTTYTIACSHNELVDPENCESLARIIENHIARYSAQPQTEYEITTK